jgi:rod shape-determining protein MreC
MARPRGANRRRFVLAVVLLTSVTLITLDTRNGRSGPLGAVGRAAHTIVSPIEGAVSSVTRPIGDWWSGLVDSGSIKKENRRLRERVLELDGEQRRAADALQRNRELNRLLHLQQSFLDTAKPIAARVVNRDPGNFESTLTIDRGTQDGIADGMPVVAPGGVVGHVIEVWRNGANVRVLTDPESAIAVRPVAHPVTGIAQGHEGSDEIFVDDFGAHAQVHKGDEVVTANIANSVYPPDLLVGTVTGVDEQSADLGLSARIKPYVQVDELQFVEVLRWVPGQGPVVTTTTTTTTTTTLPGATTTTTTTPTTTTGSAP